VDDELGSHSRPLRNQRYELRSVLGATSASVVYRAFDRASRVEVALKRLRTALPDPDEVFRLKREFRQLRDIKHPNLVVLHDLEVSDDDCFYTMVCSFTAS
jgi:serine/threonine protein kinase